MKKIIMIVSMAVATIGFSYAQGGQDHQGMGQQQERTITSDEMSRINEEQLPANVQGDLRTGQFAEWEVDETYRVDEEVRAETGSAYVVSVEKDDEKVFLHYDADGNLIKQERKEDKEKRRGKDN